MTHPNAEISGCAYTHFRGFPSGYMSQTWQQGGLKMHDYYVENRSGMKLHCQMFGAGMPILMIHGSASEGSFFTDTAQHLARDYLVITYDRRGSGRSEGSAEGIYDVPSQADDAADILQNLGRPAVVVSHSAGGCVAMELAVRCPQLVEKLIMMEPVITDCFPPDHPGVQQIRGSVDLMRDNQTSQATAQLRRGSDPEDLGMVRKKRTKEQKEQAAKNTSHFMQNEFIHFSTYETDYERLRKVPVVLGLTDYDAKSFFGEVARKLSELLACSIVVFPGRHNCPQDLPREFAYVTSGILRDENAFSKKFRCSVSSSAQESAAGSETGF